MHRSHRGNTENVCHRLSMFRCFDATPKEMTFDSMIFISLLFGVTIDWESSRVDNSYGTHSQFIRFDD